MASEVTVEATVVRDTQPRETDGRAGSGMVIEQELASSAPSIGHVFASVIERSRDFGVLIAASPVTIATTVVRDTMSTESGRPFGDGVAVFGVPATERISVSSSRIERSARAGLSNFGSIVSLRDVHIACAAVRLDGEPFVEWLHVFEDGGGNACGCPIADGACKADAVLLWRTRRSRPRQGSFRSLRLFAIVRGSRRRQREPCG